MHPEFASMNGADNFGEYRWRNRGQHAAVDTILQGARDEVLLKGIGEEQDLRVGTLGTNSGEHFQPLQLWHPHTQQQNMRLEGFHPTQHLAAIRGFADNPNVSLLREEPSEHSSEEGMSVSDEYSDHVHIAHEQALRHHHKPPSAFYRNTPRQVNALWVVPAFRVTELEHFVSCAEQLSDRTLQRLRPSMPKPSLYYALSLRYATKKPI